MIPLVYKGGKTGNLSNLNLYEYTFIINENSLEERLQQLSLDNNMLNFTLYKWDDKFTKTSDWIIASNNILNNNINSIFIDFILQSIKAYNYNGNHFKNDDDIIRESIVKNKDIIKKI